MRSLCFLLAWPSLVLAGPPPAVSDNLTFHKDIEPILQQRCQSCHRPGEAAPFSLLTYQDARPWAKAIRAALITGKMPPWHADPHYGKFLTDLSMGAGEREKIIAWIDQGVKEGNPADAPKPKTFPQ